MTTQDIKLMLVAIFTAIHIRLGDLAIPVYLMLGAQVIDFVTGWMAAPYRDEPHTSGRLYKGITKKIMQWVLVAVGLGLDVLVQYCSGILGIGSIPPMFGVLSIVWTSCNEAISILENVRDTDTPTPSFLQKLIELLKLTTEQKGEQSAPDTDKEETHA